MLDDIAFHLIEYDDRGVPIRDSLESVSLPDPDTALEELTAAWDALELEGASRTGAKSIPDNTDSWGPFFCMSGVSDQPPTRRTLPVWEVEEPWRRGWGIASWSRRRKKVRIWGLWVRGRKPQRTEVEVFVDHSRMNISPADLLGPPRP